MLTECKSWIVAKSQKRPPCTLQYPEGPGSGPARVLTSDGTNDQRNEHDKEDRRQIWPPIATVAVFRCLHWINFGLYLVSKKVKLFMFVYSFRRKMNGGTAGRARHPVEQEPKADRHHRKRHAEYRFRVGTGSDTGFQH